MEFKDLDHYQQLAAKLINPKLSHQDRLSNFTMGLVGEIFETYNAARSADGPGVGHKRVPRRVLFAPETAEEVNKELGDIMWYSVALLHTFGRLAAVEYFVRYRHDPVARDRTATTRNDSIKTFYSSWRSASFKAAAIIDPVKKHLYQGHAIGENVEREICDCVCCVMSAVHRMAVANGSSLREVCSLNLDKLYARYPDGKFSEEASRSRRSE